jgi:hypothetical protein
MFEHFPIWALKMAGPKNVVAGDSHRKLLHMMRENTVINII